MAPRSVERTHWFQPAMKTFWQFNAKLPSGATDIKYSSVPVRCPELCKSPLEVLWSTCRPIANIQHVTLGLRSSTARMLHSLQALPHCCTAEGVHHADGITVGTASGCGSRLAPETRWAAILSETIDIKVWIQDTFMCSILDFPSQCMQPCDLTRSRRVPTLDG